MGQGLTLYLKKVHVPVNSILSGIYKIKLNVTRTWNINLIIRI